VCGGRCAAVGGYWKAASIDGGRVEEWWGVHDATLQDSTRYCVVLRGTTRYYAVLRGATPYLWVDPYREAHVEINVKVLIGYVDLQVTDIRAHLDLGRTMGQLKQFLPKFTAVIIFL
jgi:hypothetical protein